MKNKYIVELTSIRTTTRLIDVLANNEEKAQYILIVNRRSNGR